ncbi:MAG TPA: hypothetical protein VMU29_13330 [Smithella sp.]|nr:hypothetical protein [Smithella sp.]
MNVKGTAYLTRKDTVIKTFGEERWNSFMAKLAEKDKYFNQTIMSVTLIPLDKFFLFLDDLLKEFFNNDKMSYWKLGEKSADYSLSPGGPYQSYLLTRDLKNFVDTAIPKLWSTYFDGGIFNARIEDNVAHVTISGLPIQHIYFEYLIMGYIRQALVLFGIKSVEHRVRGFSIGNKDIYYKFELKNA